MQLVNYSIVWFALYMIQPRMDSSLKLRERSKLRKIPLLLAVFSENGIRTFGGNPTGYQVLRLIHSAIAADNGIYSLAQTNIYLKSLTFVV